MQFFVFFCFHDSDSDVEENIRSNSSVEENIRSDPSVYNDDDGDDEEDREQKRIRVAQGAQQEPSVAGKNFISLLKSNEICNIPVRSVLDSKPGVYAQILLQSTNSIKAINKSVLAHMICKDFPNHTFQRKVFWNHLFNYRKTYI